MKLTIPITVQKMLGILSKADFEAYIVGGSVRELLLDRPVKDWDITTSATPDQIMPLFKGSFYDNNFGTVMIAPQQVIRQLKTKDQPQDFDTFDITTFRLEYGYADKRRPDKITWGKTLEEDLKRRDFTINAMALKLQVDKPKSSQSQVEGMVIDPFHGQVDLKDKLIKAVGKADERFSEDALRMMRAIRFASQLGFTIEPKTLKAIESNASLLQHISWERIRDEFLKTISSDYPVDGILTLYSTGLLQYIMPEMIETRQVPQAGRHKLDVWNHSLESLRHCASTNPIVRLATLIHDIGKPLAFREGGPRGVTFYGHEVVGARIAGKIADRLKLSNAQKEKLIILVRWHMFVYEPHMTDAAIRRFIKRVGKDNINDMMLLRVGDRKGGGSKATSWRLRELQKRIGEQFYEPMSPRDLKINGHDIMKELKLKPGPKVGQIIDQLFEEVMEDSKLNTKSKLLKRAKELNS